MINQWLDYRIYIKHFGRIKSLPDCPNIWTIQLFYLLVGVSNDVWCMAKSTDNEQMQLLNWPALFPQVWHAGLNAQGKYIQLFLGICQQAIDYVSRDIRKCLRTCAHSKDSDQSAHSRSLITIFTGRIMNSQTCRVFLCFFLCGQWCSLGAHVRRYVLWRKGSCVFD